MDPKFFTVASLVAAFAAIGAFWTQAKGFARYITGFVVLQKRLSSSVAHPVVRHLRRHYKRVPSGLSNIHGLLLRVRDSALTSPVPFDMPNSVSIWYGKRGVYLMNVGDSAVTLMSLRVISDPYELVKDAITEENARAAETAPGRSNFYITRVMGTAGAPMEGRVHSLSGGTTGSKDEPAVADSNHWSEPQIGVDRSFMYEDHEFVRSNTTNDPMRGLFFPPAVHGVLEKLQQWYTQRTWYQAHSIPWRTGVLLHGPGGTGKSSLARVIAERLGLPLYQYYLNTLTDREFVSEWENMQTPCVVALEDFDTVFHGREPVTIHKSLSFECLLNQISGINSLNGVLLIVTTNHIDKVDPALGRIDTNGRPTRPGRIDHILYMGETDQQQRQDIADFILGEWASDLVQTLVAQGPGMTAAQFQSLCVQAALERLATEGENVIQISKAKRSA